MHLSYLLCLFVCLLVLFLACSNLLLFILSDPDICPGVLRGGFRSGIQQTQKPLPQSDACCRCHADCPLLAAQDWDGGK